MLYAAGGRLSASHQGLHKNDTTGLWWPQAMSLMQQEATCWQSCKCKRIKRQIECTITRWDSRHPTPHAHIAVFEYQHSRKECVGDVIDWQDPLRSWLTNSCDRQYLAVLWPTVDCKLVMISDLALEKVYGCLLRSSFVKQPYMLHSE